MSFYSCFKVNYIIFTRTCWTFGFEIGEGTILCIKKTISIKPRRCLCVYIIYKKNNKKKKQESSTSWKEFVKVAKQSNAPTSLNTYVSEMSSMIISRCLQFEVEGSNYIIVDDNDAIWKLLCILLCIYLVECRRMALFHEMISWWS